MKNHAAIQALENTIASFILIHVGNNGISLLPDFTRLASDHFKISLLLVHVAVAIVSVIGVVVLLVVASASAVAMVCCTCHCLGQNHTTGLLLLWLW